MNLKCSNFLVSLFLLFVSDLVCSAQDTLVFSSGETQLAKVIEISPSQIRYKDFLNLNGPDYLIDSKLLREIRFSNGSIEKIVSQKSILTESSDTLILKNGKRIEVELMDISLTNVSFHTKQSTLVYTKNNLTINTICEASGKRYKYYHGHWVDESKLEGLISERIIKPVKWGDFVKVNLETGLIFNDAFCNSPVTTKVEPNVKFATVDEYTKTSSEKQFWGYCFGLNLILGKSPYFKHLIGANTIQSEGEYHYLHIDGQVPFYLPVRSKTDIRVHTVTNYINISSGLGVTFFKKVHFDNLLSWNTVISAKNTVNGLERNSYYQNNGYYAGILIRQEDKYYKDEINHEKYVKQAFSFTSKLSVDVTIHNQRIGIYLFRNIGLLESAHLPWTSLGLVYYPFHQLKY